MIQSDFTPFGPGKQPYTLPVLPDAIPAELKVLSRWVGWRWAEREGEWTKPPICVQTGALAKSNDSTTWCAFDAALHSYQNGGRLAGVGFVLAPPFVGVDLDDCRDPKTGALESWAYAILQQFATYTEVSPSGTGIKLICRGDLPVDGTNKPNGWPVEMYQAGRYFTLTGQRIEGTPGEVRDASEAVGWLYERITTQAPPAWVVSPSVAVVDGEREAHREGGTPPKTLQTVTGHAVAALSDADLLRKVAESQQAGKFGRLMAVDTSGYASHSQADIALCNILAYYSADAAQIDRIFRQSALYRPKWDERHHADGRTYGRMTIDDALGYVRRGGNVYDPNYRSAEHRSAAPPMMPPPPEEPPDLASPPDLPPPSPDDVLAALGRGELGDAELLAKRWAGRIAYDHAEGGWHVWAGHSWQRDERKAVDALPGTKLAALYLAAAADLVKDADSRKQADALGERARLLWRRNRIANVLHLAARQDALSLSGREWDAQPWLLAVQNGVVDLQTGDLRPGQPGDYLRTQAPTGWEGLDAPAPRWERFLSEVFDGDSQLIAFVQRLLGYAITGASTEHVLPILWGKGRNGKDTLLKALAYTLGAGFADSVPEEVFIDAGRTNGGNATPHVYKLRGLRLAWASETEEGARLTAGQVKLISGGGILTARPLYGAPVSWEATHTVLLITNHRPHVSADDYAMWKRIVLIPFALSFVDGPTEPNERQRDPNLDAKLKAEAPGILAWLVRGCLAWQRDGLRPPECVKAATDAYRSDEDTLGQWLAECCIVGDSYTCKALAAYESYAAWCKVMNLRALTGTSFGKKITERFRKDTTRTGIVYSGLGLLAAETP